MDFKTQVMKKKNKLCRTSIVKLVFLNHRFPETSCPAVTPCPEAQPRQTGAEDFLIVQLGPL